MDRKTFDVSVIMAVYQVEDFLDEALNSLVNQTLGFDRVQVILVDDGSTDNSGKLCDTWAARYPEQIIAIHKPNGGQASARNLGLTKAAGRYINFMDPDDVLTENTLADVCAFFDAHANETDVVAVPMFFFGAQDGPHWQNGKFNKGDRVIQLLQEYKVQQTSTASCFYHQRVKHLLHFDERLPNSEDFKVNLTLFCERPTLGVVSTAKYMYRKRPSGNSTIDQVTMKKQWYFDWYLYLNDWACECFKAKYGYLPAFMQYAILSDLLWRFHTDYSQQMQLTLNAQEQQHYYKETRRSLQPYDDRYIMELPRLRIAHKLLMLRCKYGCLPEMTPVGPDDLLLHYQNTNLMTLSSTYARLDFLRIEKRTLSVEGSLNLVGMDADEQIEVFVTDGSAEKADLCCEIKPMPAKSQERLGIMLYRSLSFAFRMPLECSRSVKQLRLGLILRGKRVLLSRLEAGRFMPVTHQLANSCCHLHGWAVSLSGDTLCLEPTNRTSPTLMHEMKLLRELWKGNRLGMRKAVLVRAAYRLLKPFCRKPLWLFSDRVMRAGDNGEAMFRYVMQHPVKGVKPCFVLHSQSQDYAGMKKVGTVIPYDSMRSKLMHLMAECVVSSAGEVSVRNPFDDRIPYYCDLMPEQRYVFLQHGVTKDDQSAWLNRRNKAIDGFVTSGQGEYDSIVNGEDYDYQPGQVWLTGMPRYDFLERNSKRLITLMPTWRQYLMTRYDPESGAWQMDEQRFRESDFYQFYAGLLRHPELIRAAKKYGYTIQFYPHPNLMPFIGLFGFDPSVRILHEDMTYRQVFAESDLVVTDYSSTAFDFAWLYQPVVYAQFDADQFFSGVHVYKKGYFDYERDGFGEVTHDIEETVRTMIAYMENGCRMKDEYRERVDRFFAWHDHENSQRVYEQLLKLTGRGAGR